MSEAIFASSCSIRFNIPSLFNPISFDSLLQVFTIGFDQRQGIEIRENGPGFESYIPLFVRQKNDTMILYDLIGRKRIISFQIV